MQNKSEAKAALVTAVNANGGSDAACASNTNASHMSTEVSELYAQYCKECTCKVNTSLHNYLRHNVATTRSLVSLSLSNNYLGSKGLRPVWKLLEHCDALRELNVEGNGVDNECVQELCHALLSHLFLEILNLNHNPISATGGRVLLEFVKEHPSLIQLSVENTDMTESLLSRLQTAIEMNRFQSNRTDKPQLIAMQHTNDVKQATSESSRKVLCPLPPPRNRHATLELIQSSVSSEETHSAGLEEKHTDEMEENYTHKDNKVNAHICTHQISCDNNNTHDKLTNVNKVPLPALATKEKSIAPKQQMTKLSSEFVNLLTHDGAISVKANNALIDKAERNNNKNIKQIDECKNGIENCKTSGSNSNDKTKITNVESAHEEKEEEEELCFEEEERLTESCEGANHDKSEYKQENEHSISKGNNNDNVDGTVTKAITKNTVSVSPLEAEEEYEKEDKMTVQNVKELTCLSTREQFQALFAQGCREYGVHHLDAAYVAWNEAMQLALKTRNREWMAVLSNNLQQLSYELLVEEGQAHLSSHELEQADGCFAMALDVAHKAHNAQWEKTMTEARTNVQEAVFFKCHEAALSLFTKAQEVCMIKCERRKMNALNSHYHNSVSCDKTHTNTNTHHTVGVNDETVKQNQNNNQNYNNDSDDNNDQFFLLPGTDVMVAHTNQFIDTWEWILLVQEAVRTWSEAARVARKIRNKTITSSSHSSFIPHSNYNGSFDKHSDKEELSTYKQTANVYTLSEMINNELTNVACFLVSRFFDMSRPEATQNELCWQYTSSLHYHECILLSEVLWDMLSYSDQYLHHAAFAGVVSLQLGNLYVASHQLSLAERQFTNVITCGQELQEPLFIASGLFFAALLNYQRANYAQAEHFLGEALIWWERIRSNSSGNGNDVSVQSTEIFTSSSGQHNITAFDKSSDSKLKEHYLTKLHILLLNAIPAHYISVMHNACYRLLIQVCVNTFRYREALEVLESSLVQSARDELYHKLQANFTIQPTLDQIAGISITLHSPLLYYFLFRQYDWDETLHGYRVEEHILIWAIPECAELKFVDVNVSNDFNISVTSLLHKIRSALHLNPFMSSNLNDNGNKESMIVSTEHFPHSTWIIPLQTLYTILVSPIKEYVKALCSTPQGIDSVWTIIPCEELRLVPFNALISTPLTERIIDNNSDNYNKTNEVIPYYWIEEIALQMELSATHGAFSALSALRLYKHNQQTYYNKLNSDTKQSKVEYSKEFEEETEDHVGVQVTGRPVRDLIVLQPAGELPILVEQHLTTSSYLSELHSTFEFDNTRCATEGNIIEETWRTAAEEYKQSLSHKSCTHRIAELCKAISPMVVDEINLLRQLLPQARLLHIAAGVVSLSSNELSNNLNNERSNKNNNDDTKSVNTFDSKAVTMYINNPNIQSDFDNNCNNYSCSSNESYGALVVGGMHPELSLLTSYELGQLELTAPLAICSSTHLSQELMRNDVDGAMSIVRAFHSAQIPSVILSQWCTPDMKPSELFTLFYKELFNTIYALHQNNNQIKYIDRDYLLNTNYQLNRDVTQNSSSDNDKYNNNTSNTTTTSKISNTHYHHQPISIAVLLAHAIRLMLHNSSKPAACDDFTVDLRYCPRKWAAYYCFGCGASDLVESSCVKF